MRFSLFLVLGCILMAVGTIQAQSRYWGPGWGGYSYHASTAGEGYMRGMSDVIRSQGMRNMMNSEAAKNMEDARAKYIDNRLKSTKAYFEMKRYNKEYRDATKTPRPTSEQLFRLAKEATPKALSPAELDPVTGAISWPQLLNQDDFASARQTIDQLFAQRAKASGKFTIDQAQKASQAVSDLQVELRRRINDYPPQVFSQTNAFLKRLSYEVRKGA